MNIQEVMDMRLLLAVLLVGVPGVLGHETNIEYCDRDGEILIGSCENKNPSCKWIEFNFSDCGIGGPGFMDYCVTGENRNIEIGLCSDGLVKWRREK